MGGYHMKKRKLPDQEILSIFAKAARIKAPEHVVRKLRRKIADEEHGSTSEAFVHSSLRLPGRRLVMAVLLTLIVSVPLTFFTTKYVLEDRPVSNNYVVRFVFEKGDAQSVKLVGDFNGWNSEQTEMRRVAHTDLWMTEVVLSQGLYRYGFLIDNKDWAVDPIAKINVKDDFGKESSLLMLLDETGNRKNL
jgi:hypothetical protein